MNHLYTIAAYTGNGKIALTKKAAAIKPAEIVTRTIKSSESENLPVRETTPESVSKALSPRKKSEGIEKKAGRPRKRTV